MNATLAIPQKETITKAQSAANQQWGGLFRVSGILLIITAVIWTIVTWAARSLYSTGYPSTPEAYLQLVSQHQLLANMTWILWIIADLLLMAPTVVMYLLLRPFNRTLALIGSLFAMFFNIYDVCTSELNSLTLVQLSQGYASATTEAMKAAYVAAAGYGYYALPIQTVLSFAIGTFGYLLWCVPMFKSMFRRFTAIFGMFWCVVGLIGSLAPLYPSNALINMCQFLCVPAVGLWFVMVGVQLYRYAIRMPTQLDTSEIVS